MLYQSKLLIDASKKVGIEFIVHLGVYSSKNDFIPNFFLSRFNRMLFKIK